ncbi:BspA family leucine-rich repeat surface protein, partial [Allobaculum sp.]|uniref:BspA family leucine-rich repeat surface protein n=1 Tax=Allobaculum sp. TaxID=1872463 RepID=UPI00399B7434
MKRKLLTALLCSSLLLSGTAIPVIAQEAGTELQSEATIVHSGKIGTADWTIDSNGVLTIGEGEFTNNFYEYTFPWARYPNDIKRVDGTARFKLKGRAHSIFDSESITSIDLSGWDTSAVTDMSYMFCNCKTLTKLNLSGFNTSSVTKMRGMFYGCNALSELNLSSWDTSAVMDMSGMFISCKALSKLNLSGFNTSSVTDMSCMFS